MPRSPAHPDAGRNRAKPGHMLSQDGDAVREFGRFNFVDHRLETKRGKIFAAAEKGSSNPSTA